MENIKFQTFLKDARIAALFLAGVSLAALAGAYFFQYVVGLAPCPLCLYQRIPHALVIALGFLAYYVARSDKPKMAALIIFICGMVSLAGSGLGFYHTGVEHHWWTSFIEACSIGVDTSAGNFLQQIEQTKAVRCDTVPWSLFGISMAGYNGLISLAMFFYAIAASILITRRANGF